MIPGNTLLFLDEIQECPNARTALKSFAEDGSFTVVASGSLLGIRHKKNKLKKTPRSLPVGYERQVTMYSLSFEEYLWARGRGERAVAALRKYLSSVEWLQAAKMATLAECVNEALPGLAGRAASMRPPLLGRKTPDAETVEQAVRYRASLVKRPGWVAPVETAVVEVFGNVGYNWHPVCVTSFA